MTMASAGEPAAIPPCYAAPLALPALRIPHDLEQGLPRHGIVHRLGAGAYLLGAVSPILGVGHGAHLAINKAK
jgi:hypothetical protein